jgi:hypothetical protein
MMNATADSFSVHMGADQLVRLIHAAAAREIGPQDFVESFRDLHEALEASGRVRYASKEQARLIWDVLWELEFYSPDPSREPHPEEWNTIEMVMKTVERVAGKLAALPG